MPLTLVRRALLLVAVPCIALVMLLAAVYVAQRKQEDAQRRSSHARDVLQVSEQFLTALREAQTGVRGFLLTGEARYLAPYDRARGTLPAAQARLEALTRDSPGQAGRARALRRPTNELLDLYQQQIALTRDVGTPASLHQPLLARDKPAMDAVERDLQVFREEEERLAEESRQGLAQAQPRLVQVALVGTATSLLVVLAVGTWFEHGLRRRVQEVTGLASRLSQGADAGPPDASGDELSVIDHALRDLAQALARQRRATVAALSDAVSLFSEGRSSQMVLDLAAQKARELSSARLVICSACQEGGSAQRVVAVSADQEASWTPPLGTMLSWRRLDEVCQQRHVLRISRDRVDTPDDAPAAPHPVLERADWIGAPVIGADGRAIGVLQAVDPVVGRFTDDDRDVVDALTRAASAALAVHDAHEHLEARVNGRTAELAALNVVLQHEVQDRLRAERALRQLNVDLESRVEARTRDLATANTELAEKNTENELFVYSVSHDLRSPLVNLEGFSRELSLAGEALRRVLDGPEVPESVRARAGALVEHDMTECITFIRTAVGRLDTIIDGLLRLSRAGRVEYRMRPLALGPLVARIVDAMHSTAATTGARITVGTLPVVVGDALAVEQIFANLVGNALTYVSPHRPPVIDVAAEPQLASRAAATVIRVRDNGLGIPEAHVPKAFQPLQRLHPGVGRGEGMGLAIVRRIAERHQGRVWVESRVGEGSTFFVELPLVSEEDDNRAA